MIYQHKQKTKLLANRYIIFETQNFYQIKKFKKKSNQNQQKKLPNKINIAAVKFKAF